MTEDETYHVGWDLVKTLVCFPGAQPAAFSWIHPGTYMFLSLGPFANECRGVSENFILLSQLLPSGTRVLSDVESEERLENHRAKIHLDPPFERKLFSELNC